MHLRCTLSSEGFCQLSTAASPTAKCRFGSKFAVVSRISPSGKKASVQIARFMMVSCSVADELKTDLIARNMDGVMGSRSGLGLLPNTLALPVLLAISASRRGLVMAGPSRLDST